MPAPGYWKPIILSILGAVFLVAAESRNQTQLSGMIILAYLVGTIFLIAALVNWIDLIWHRVNLRLGDTFEATAMTSQVLLVQAIARLNYEQVKLVDRFGLKIKTRVGIPEADHVLVCGDEEIPMDWVLSYLTECSKSYPKMKARRDYSDGTDDRHWAAAFQDQLAKLGMGSPAIGNRPMVLTVSWSDLLSSLGLGDWSDDED